MIRHRIDRSSMAYSTQQTGARGGLTQARTKSTRLGTPNICVGVASLSQWRRMPRATPAFEARLKPPPGPAPSFSPGLPRAPPPSLPQRRRYG